MLPSTERDYSLGITQNVVTQQFGDVCQGGGAAGPNIVYPLVKQACNLGSPQWSQIFYTVNGTTHDGYYWIQNAQLAISCPNFSWLTYDSNSPYCTTPCNPATNSECASWTVNFDRAPVTTTSRALKKPWKVVKKLRTYGYPGSKCHYWFIQTAATDGCMLTKPYYMTFVDIDATVDSPFNFYLIPNVETAANSDVKAFAAYQSNGLKAVML